MHFPFIDDYVGVTGPLKIKWYKLFRRSAKISPSLFGVMDSYLKSIHHRGIEVGVSDVRNRKPRRRAALYEMPRCPLRPQSKRPPSASAVRLSLSRPSPLFSRALSGEGGIEMKRLSLSLSLSHLI